MVVEIQFFDRGTLLGAYGGDQWPIVPVAKDLVLLPGHQAIKVRSRFFYVSDGNKLIIRVEGERP